MQEAALLQHPFEHVGLQCDMHASCQAVQLKQMLLQLIQWLGFASMLQQLVRARPPAPDSCAGHASCACLLGPLGCFPQIKQQGFRSPQNKAIRIGSRTSAHFHFLLEELIECVEALILLCCAMFSAGLLGEVKMLDELRSGAEKIEGRHIGPHYLLGCAAAAGPHTWRRDSNLVRQRRVVALAVRLRLCKVLLCHKGPRRHASKQILGSTHL